MKKIKLDFAKMEINKTKITSLQSEEMSGIRGGYWTEGTCTSGCTDSGHCSTLWNCTNASCSADCLPTASTRPSGSPCNYTTESNCP